MLSDDQVMASDKRTGLGDMQIEGPANRLRRIAAEAPHRIFAQFGDEEITFGQLAGAAAAVARDMGARGLNKGDRVLVMMANSPASLAIVHGLLYAGLVWVPVNPAALGEGLAHIIRTAEPSLILCDAGLEDRFASLSEARELPLVVMSGSSLPAPAEPGATAPRPDDLAALMFTSGTTGPAKAVMVSHTMLELAARAVALCTAVRPGDILFVWEPFYHIGGAQVILLPLLHEVKLVITSRFSASQFWQQVSEAGCTHIHHLGGIIQILLKQPDGPFDRKHAVRTAWGGGCAIEAWRPFEQRFGVEIRECYGMTECSSLTTFNDEGVVGSIGRPLPWFDVDLRDAEGRILGPGEGRGEIVVRSHLPGAITRGYYRNPQATAEAITSDGFHTGDLGSWDAEGRLFFHGRKTDSVRSRGENVSAYEVESVALRHPQIRDVAMIGVKAEIGEQDIQLFIQPQPGQSPDPAEISEWLAARLTPWQRPRYIAFVDDFPRTPSQRIQKHLLPIEPADRWEAPGKVRTT